jgi:hypothetical protein
VIAKVRRASDVWWVDVLLTQPEETLGQRKRIALEVLIEETEGLNHVDEIATASTRWRPLALLSELLKYDFATHGLNKVVTDEMMAASSGVRGLALGVPVPAGLRRADPA